MKNFNWQDPFQLDRQISEEESLIQNNAKRYATEKLQPRVIENFRKEQIDMSIFREMGELGLLGMTLPTIWGGSHASYVAYGLVAQEIEAVDSGYRSMLSVQSSLVMEAINAFGTEEQKQKYLLPLSQGKKIGCFGLTEANAGSDPSGMQSIAQSIAEGYQLEGEKTWITNSPIADVFIVWMRSTKHNNKVQGFILEREMLGLSTPSIEGKLSLRTAPTGKIVMNQIKITEQHLLPKATGLAAAFHCLNNARYGIAWGAMGAAKCCWQTAREYGLLRHQFNRPLAQTQLFQKKLADMQTEIALGLQAALRVGRLFDENQATSEVISLIKRNNVSKALEIARQARDMLGANGIVDQYPVMRHLMNLETVNTYEGTHDIHGLILGRAQTGLSAF